MNEIKNRKKEKIKVYEVELNETREKDSIQ